MKKQSLALAALAFAAAPAFGQTYDNGGMDPQPGGCNGNQFSMIEAPSTVYGNNTIVTSFHQADDFTVPSGQTWNPTQLTWFLYQTNSSENDLITAVYIQLWEGTQADMLAGTANLIGGDMVTNRYISQTFSGVYRVPSSDPASCARAIKEVKIDMSWVGALPDGQYWIEIGSTGNPAFSGPWANHVVPRDGNENSVYFTVSTGLWAANNSNGVGWDYPFKLDYTGGGGGYTIALGGDCPGRVTYAWSGAPANSQQAILHSGRTGSFVIPSGNPCAGTTTGLGGIPDVFNIIGTGNGAGQVGATLNQGACGRFVQGLAIGGCVTSNVAQVP